MTENPEQEQGPVKTPVADVIEGWISDPEQLTAPLSTEAGQKAAAKALEEIKGRSFSGRHPELGPMVNCQICGLRHRQNERKCEQEFSTSNREGDPIQGELVPPEGLTHLTARQVLGAKFFSRRRQRPRRTAPQPMTKWQKVLKAAEEKKKNAVVEK